MVENFKTLYQHQTKRLRKILKKFYEGDNLALQEYIIEVQSRCKYLIDPPGTHNSYLTAIAIFSKDKIYESYLKSREAVDFPSIDISYTDDLKPIFSKQLKVPGSPQDVLYTITSERASGWISSLTELGFTSANMSGSGIATLLTCPRFLDLSEPDLVLSEVPGSIPRTFYRTLGTIQNSSIGAADLSSLFSEELNKNGIFPTQEDWAQDDFNKLIEIGLSSSGYKRCMAEIAKNQFSTRRQNGNTDLGLILTMVQNIGMLIVVLR